MIRNGGRQQPLSAIWKLTFALCITTVLAACGGGGGGGGDGSDDDEPTPDSVRIQPSVDHLVLGESQRFTAEALFPDGNREDVTNSGEWSSTDTDVATIDAQGNISIVAPGRTSIHFRFRGRQDSHQIMVSDLSLSGSEYTLRFGETRTIVAAGGDDRVGTYKNVTDKVRWRSSDENVATVENGVVSPKMKGTAEIIAELGGFERTATVDVVAVELTSLSIEPGDLEVKEGQYNNFQLTATYEDGSTADVTEHATWTSNNTDVATVDDSVANGGRVYGVAPGSTTVTAQLGQFQAPSNVEVLYAPNAAGEITLKADPNVVLEAEGNDLNTDKSTLRAQLVPNDTDNGTIAEGTEVKFEIIEDNEGTLDPTTAGTNSGVAETTFHSDTAGRSIVRATIPDTGLSDTVSVYTVSSFASAIGLTGSTDVTEEEDNSGEIPEGRRFQLFGSNATNRTFVLTRVVFANGDKDLYDTASPTNQWEEREIRGGKILATQIFELGKDQTDRGFKITLHFRDEPTGQDFTTRPYYFTEP